MISPDALVRGVLTSLLGGRRKRSRRALRFLTGGRWLSARTLLTAAGMAWGVYEMLHRRHEATGPPAVAPPPAPPPPAPAAAPAPEAEVDVSGESLRIVRLAVSAAGADGAVTDREMAAIVQQARSIGVAEIVEREAAQPRALAEIVDGVTDQVERATLYVLAYTIVRADEEVTGAERIYLARLAHLLGLGPDDVQVLENETGERIDLGDQGQLGG